MEDGNNETTNNNNNILEDDSHTDFGNSPTDIPKPPKLPNSRGGNRSTDNKYNYNALELSWSFGINKNIPVLNLTTEAKTIIAYVCGHAAVLYDYMTNQQKLLHGHTNSISCTCCSDDRRWLATGDAGADGMIIIWDANAGIPVRTIFEPHPEGGVVALSLTPDSKYLASLSAGYRGQAQALAIWDWTMEDDTPLCTATLSPSFGQQTYILFNPEDTSQLVTNSDSQVVFYQWTTNEITYFAPPLNDDDFNKPVGKYSNSIFQSNSSRALTATSLGNLVVWDTNKPLTKMEGNEATPDKKALKLLKLQDKGITVLMVSDNRIVMGDSIGHIKFYDQNLKLMHWYQDFQLGPINALSFSYQPDFLVTKERPAAEYPHDATIKARQFVIKDFVIGTSNAVLARCSADGTDVNVIHTDHDAAVHALAAHSSRPYIAVGSYAGLIKVWHYVKCKVVVSRQYDKGQMIRCCSYDPSGHYLALGFTNGSISVLDAISLKDITQTFKCARDMITHITFSHDSVYMAAADAESTVTLFMASTRDDSNYVYLGRMRAHYQPICDLMFGVQLDSNLPRLMSLGEDRYLVEYDLENSMQDDLKVLTSDRIEQSAIPRCMTWYPPITKENFVLTANNQFKYKLYNSTTKMCRKTLLGPTFGTELQRMCILPTTHDIGDKRYMAFVTGDKVGLQMMPLDGNPHHSVAMAAHPMGVANLAVSFDGKYVFTAGGSDAIVHKWDVNIGGLEAHALLGGQGLIPFYGLLEGGREGALFRELQDYFYYAQIRNQGVDTLETREISTRIAIDEIPFVVRAMGFYPSEQEIDDMMNEVKYQNYANTGTYTAEIDLGDFIKLFVNHRPPFGIQNEKLSWAFQVLSDLPGQDNLHRADFLDTILTRGEPLTDYELAEYLTTLMGFNEEGGSSEKKTFNADEASSLIDSNLPRAISSQTFVDKILGFSSLMEENVVEQT